MRYAEQRALLFDRCAQIPRCKSVAMRVHIHEQPALSSRQRPKLAHCLTRCADELGERHSADEGLPDHRSQTVAILPASPDHGARSRERPKLVIASYGLGREAISPPHEPIDQSG